MIEKEERKQKELELQENINISLNNLKSIFIYLFNSYLIIYFY